MAPPPEYSHSFAQTSDAHDDTASKRLSLVTHLHDIDENADVAHDDTPYPEPSPGDLVHPSDFRPFFTLIEDPETGEHHHPSIHYVFGDDDPDFLTSAIINYHSLQNDQSQSTHSGDRLVLIDVAADGKTVTEAQSLSPDWQVANTTVSQAPSWNETEQSRRDGSLMLTISGTETPVRPAYQQRKSSDGMLGRIDDIVTGYQERLGTLEKLIKRDVVNHPDMEALLVDEPAQPVGQASGPTA